MGNPYQAWRFCRMPFTGFGLKSWGKGTLQETTRTRYAYVYIYIYTQYIVYIYMCRLADKGPSIHLQYCQCVPCAFRSERHHARNGVHQSRSLSLCHSPLLLPPRHCLYGSSACAYFDQRQCDGRFVRDIIPASSLDNVPKHCKKLPLPARRNLHEHTMPNKSNPHLLSLGGTSEGKIQIIFAEASA